MANVAYFAALAGQNIHRVGGPGAVLEDTATSRIIEVDSGWGDTLTFAFAGENLNTGSGIVSGLTIRDSNDKTLFSLDGLPATFVPGEPSPIAFVFVYDTWINDSTNDMLLMLMGRDDVVTGSAKRDQINTGAGDDIVKAGAGIDDVIDNDGADRYFGGSNFDYLDYFYYSFFGPADHNGVTLDIRRGTAIDIWGNTDTFSGFEFFELTIKADTVRFANDGRDQTVYGYEGADTFIAGANSSSAELSYYLDDFYGGDAGIVADLGGTQNKAGKPIKGTIVDGYGDTDTVVNIHRVIGTNAADVFVGSRLDDHFHGADGKDRYDGGKGSDFIEFKFYTAGGIKVDLGKARGQVIDDGYGNTETAISIENVIAGQYRDRVIGNDADNILVGGGDRDRMTGGLGADTFAYGYLPYTVAGLFKLAVKEFRDTITDFVSGEDHLVFAYDNFKGMDATVRFTNGTAASSNTQSSFFFDASTHGLYWDSDGRQGSKAALLVATLEGVAAMSASDITLVTFAQASVDFW